MARTSDHSQNWGGARRGAGPKPKAPAEPGAQPTIPAAPKRAQPALDTGAMLRMIEASIEHKRNGPRTQENNPFRLPLFPERAMPPKKELRMAMDSLPELQWGNSQWTSNAFSGWASEGLLFLGYPYLSELAQRPEYRVMAETIATEMTRKWIKFGGTQAKKKAKAKGATDEDAEGEQGEADDKNDKIKQLVDFQDHLKVREHYSNSILNDGLFGRSHLFHNLGADGGEELKTPIGNGRDSATKAKVTKGSLKSLKVIEPMWAYPTSYNAQNPLATNWYNPDVWFVLGTEIHHSRLLRFVSKPVPDMLKPAYAFGGLALTQMAKPYVDIWLTTRESVGQMIHAFSVMVLETDLQTLMQPGGADNLLARAAMFNMLRDNQGLFMTNKASEGFSNVSAPLGGLHELQAQSQEHMMCLPAGTLIETERGEVPIEQVTLNDRVLTRQGFHPIAWVGVTDIRDTLIEIEVGDRVLRATEEHPIWSESINEFVNAENVSPSHRLLALGGEENTGRRWHGADAGGIEPRPDTTETQRPVVFSIASCGGRIADRFLLATKSIMKTIMEVTTNGPTWNWSPARNTPSGTIDWERKEQKLWRENVGSAPRNSWLLIPAPYFARRHAGPNRPNSVEVGDLIKSTRNPVSSADRRLARSEKASPNIARRPAHAMPVMRVRRIEVPRQPVYNIEVEGGPPEFFANGILVHNSVSRIPAVKFTGIEPTGMNASSEGTLRTFYDTMNAGQNHFVRPNLNVTTDLCMISLWGERDPDIVYDFVPLWEMTEKEKGEKRKADAETDVIYVDGGVVAPAEVRAKLVADPESPYQDLDPDDVPDLAEEEEQGLEPEGGRPDPKAAGEPDKGGGANDAALPFAFDAEWNEGDHPRAPDGQFGSGGGSSASKKPKLTPTEKQWLSKYSGDDFLKLNQELRGGGDGGSIAKHLDSAIAKSPLPPDTKLYRGISKDALKSLIQGDEISIGQEFSDKGFLSTSTDPNVAHMNGFGGVVLSIETGEGQNGLDMSAFNENKHEKEVLLPRGTKLKIIGIKAPKAIGHPVLVRVRTEPSNAIA
jgi:hypothetical protein